MASDLSPDKDAFVDELIASGRFPSRQHALDHAVDLLREEDETVAAIREGLASADRGEGIPFVQAVQELRVKYNIPET